MTVSAPPRPPSRTQAAPDSKPLDRGEVEALVEALIEEARRETRRRHRKYLALAALVTIVGLAALALLEGGAASQTVSPAVSARINAATQAGTSRIAFLAGVWTPSPSGPFMQTELYVMNPDGSGKRRLVRSASGRASSPVWSPDGLKLAFQKTLGPAIGQCVVCHTEIFVVNADGSGQRNLTGNLGPRATSGGDAPAWSPDGQTIAFSSARDNSSIPNLYLMNADGSGLRRVTQDAINAWGSSWSPDGRRLAFASVVRNLGNRPAISSIYAVNGDGSGQQQLTRQGSDQYPAWSPAGETIAFMRYVPKARLPEGARRQKQLRWQKELYVVNADGSGQRKLARMSDSDSSISWSPDGRRIAFVSDRDENDEVYIVNADGSGLRNLTRNPARDGHPAWSSDGRTIGFVSNRGGNRDVYVMNADGSRQQNLTRDIDRQAFGIAWSPARK